MTRRQLSSKEILQLARITKIHNIDQHLKTIDPKEAVEIIYNLNLDTDITPFIGKTDSIRLLQLAVKKNDVNLVGKCLYVPLLKNYKYDQDVFNQALDIWNTSILSLLLDRVFEERVDYDKLCKLPLNFLKQFYKLYPNDKFLHKICQFGSDEAFDHFFPQLQNLTECFRHAIKGGHLTRVKQLEHLYGNQFESDVKYKIERDLTSLETWYIADACSSGNLDLVQYLITKRQTPEGDWIQKRYGYGENVYTCPYIECAAKSGNVELLKYLFDLGYKINETMHEYWQFSADVLHILLQHGLDPLLYTIEDGGNYDYSFEHLIESRKYTNLLVLKKFCKEYEWEKIVKCIYDNITFDIHDDAYWFVPLISDVKYFQYAKNVEIIEYIMHHYGPISKEDWVNLYVNLIHYTKDNLVEKYASYIDIDMYFEILERVVITPGTKPILVQLLQQYRWMFPELG